VYVLHTSTSLAHKCKNKAPNRQMDFRDTYHCAVTLNCITIVHLCLHRIDRPHDRYLFLGVVLLTILRLVVDILFRHTEESFMIILGFFLVLEFLLVDSVVRKMQKLGSSPPIVVFFLSLGMLLADISYALYLSHQNRDAKMPVVPGPMNANDMKDGL